MKLLKRISLFLLVVLVGIQFIPTRTNQDSEPFIADFLTTYDVSEEVGVILNNSCYNCHSNNTNYPWYSNIQPIGLLLENHIYKAKAELNFSEFGGYSIRKQKSKLKSMISQVEDNEMPMASYTIIHSDARLTTESKNILVGSLKAIKKGLP